MIILGDLLDGYAGGPQDLSDEQIQSLFDRLRDRRLYGEMDWAEFELAVFTRPFDDWPIGHLEHRRVSVPECLAEKCLDFGETELAQLLGRFLCASTREHARDMIAEALGRNPIEDAKMLLEIREFSPAIFTALVRGRLDEVKHLQKKFPRYAAITRSRVRSAARFMLLYYGALDLQLIAAWHRSFARVCSELSLSSGSSGPTVGTFLKHMERMMNGVVYAAQVSKHDAALVAQRNGSSVAQGDEAIVKPGKMKRGRPPGILAKQEAEGHTLLAYFGIAIDDPVHPVIVDFLSRKLQRSQDEGALSAVPAWRATAGRNEKEPGAAKSRSKRQSGT